MTARMLASPAAEIRRLRAERDEALRMLGELVAALPDPLAEIRHTQVLCRESYWRGREDGYAEGDADGYARCDREWMAALALARAAARRAVSSPSHRELERVRWAVRGERRNRETFGQPHPADFAGRAA